MLTGSLPQLPSNYKGFRSFLKIFLITTPAEIWNFLAFNSFKCRHSLFLCPNLQLQYKGAKLTAFNHARNPFAETEFE